MAGLLHIQGRLLAVLHQTIYAAPISAMVARFCNVKKNGIMKSL